ncbi:putative Transaldolase B [Paratrimastix pyriformis]|uniref:Transaldolase n=1 Tax=Paratrimastix pyriformis TaxID=342808 RepID=A0ABQ8UW30_9EUKA|nr:putative Transaldolase B [Paratrimastix pyriformis]
MCAGLVAPFLALRLVSLSLRPWRTVTLTALLLPPPPPGQVFIHPPIPGVTPLEPAVCLQHLSENAPLLCVTYLEYLIEVRGLTDPLYHNSLVVLLHARVAQLLAKGECGHLRGKLLAFLKTSRCYQAEELLTRFQQDGFFEEQVILLSRVGRHKEALRILILTLGNIPAAESYCAENAPAPGAAADGDSDDVYRFLVEVLLEQNPPPPPAQVMAMLHKYYNRIRTNDILGQLSDSVSLADVLPYLSLVFQSQANMQRNRLIELNLRKAEDLQVPRPALPCPALPCPALPCPALPCPALPCPALLPRLLLTGNWDTPVCRAQVELRRIKELSRHVEMYGRSGSGNKPESRCAVCQKGFLGRDGLTPFVVMPDNSLLHHTCHQRQQRQQPATATTSYTQPAAAAPASFGHDASPIKFDLRHCPIRIISWTSDGVENSPQIDSKFLCSPMLQLRNIGGQWKKKKCRCTSAGSFNFLACVMIWGLSPQVDCPRHTMNQLEGLRQHTIIVADTGDVAQMAKFHPQEATTNPSLVYAAAKLPQYRQLVQEAIDWGKRKCSTPGKEQMDWVLDRLIVLFGHEILKVVPGRVSTELDPTLSFDTEASVDRARRLIALYQDLGISKDRVLIKIAATWEGIRAIEILEREGIHCNCTLIFSTAQAVAAAEARATLISPFVGRILDWYKKSRKVDAIPAAEDPGVVSVKEIYNYFRKYGHRTIVMGASFRTKEEILELAGCDNLTIAPALLDALMSSTAPVERKLSPEGARAMDIPERPLTTESAFRWELNENPMATDLLSDGIRRFAADLRALRGFVEPMLQ